MDAQAACAFVRHDRPQGAARRWPATVLQHEDVQARKCRVAGTISKIAEQTANLFQSIRVRDHSHDQVGPGSGGLGAPGCRCGRAAVRGWRGVGVGWRFLPPEQPPGSGPEPFTLSVGHAVAVLSEEAIEPGQPGSRTGCRQTRPRPTGEMMHRRMSGGRVAHARKLRDADAEIAVGAAPQRFVEQARFEQHAQPTHEVAALDAGIAHQEVGRMERAGRNHLERLGVLLDSQERGRDHVETVAFGEGQTAFQMVGLPPIVIVEDGDVEPPRVAAGPQQVVQARVPCAARALRAAAAEEVHDDAGWSPCADRLLGVERDRLGTRVTDDDHSLGDSSLFFDGGKCPAPQKTRSTGCGDQNRHAVFFDRFHDAPG